MLPWKFIMMNEWIFMCLHMDIFDVKLKDVKKMEINEQIPNLATIYYLGDNLKHIQNTDESQR